MALATCEKRPVTRGGTVAELELDAGTIAPHEVRTALRIALAQTYILRRQLQCGTLDGTRLDRGLRQIDEALATISTLQDIAPGWERRTVDS